MGRDKGIDMETLISGNGWLYADWSLSLISLVCAVATMVSMTGTPKGIHSVGIWMVSIGWLLLAARLWIQLISGGDPPISPLSLISLSLIGAGTVFYIIGKWKDK
jgi:hypothetical protein